MKLYDKAAREVFHILIITYCSEFVNTFFEKISEICVVRLSNYMQFGYCKSVEVVDK